MRRSPSTGRIHLGVGLAADGGDVSTESYLEVGWGKNELFAKEWNRLKIAGLLSFSMDRLADLA